MKTKIIEWITSDPMIEGFCLFIIEMLFLTIIVGIYILFVLVALNIAWCINWVIDKICRIVNK